MTPELMAELVARWVRFYTRSLPPAIALRRIDEIAADLYDHVAHERARGTGERRIALGVAARMVRGMAADAAWRRRTIARSPTPTQKDVTKMNKPASRSVLRVVLATALILLPLGALQIAEAMNWGLGDFALAAALLLGTGLLLELAVRKPRTIAFRAAAAAVGVAAVVLGEADDAPGLVLFGGLLIAGTVVVAVRTAQRAD